MVARECGAEVGRRVAVGEHVGTVRYVGTISSAKGTWLGIEWDDPNRGKHNGTYNGHRYFETRHPTSGSFIHIEKADFGHSFVSAIKERYGSNELTLTMEELQDLQKAMNAPHLEMVGFDKINEKQSCFSDLEVIGLHNQQVCCAGQDLASMCLRAKEVDLSLNLFNSWDQVAEITLNVPSISSLNLSFNVLELPENPEVSRDAFKNLTHLVMGHMGYTWEQILTCLKMWPEIQQLQVPFNNITSISLPEGTLTNLIHLDLEGNTISDWEEINKLGVLEKLESLNLCDLGLTSISLPTSQKLFKNLQNLMLSDNRISKWEDVAQLNKLGRLKELRFSHNPVVENMDVISMHYSIIARIGSLEILNRLKIAREERRGAELDYFKKYKNDWFHSKKNEDLKSKFLADHPRFSDLVKEYGIADQPDTVTTQSSNSMKVRLCSSTQTITRTVTKTMTLFQIVNIARRLFNGKHTMPTITFSNSKIPAIQGETDKLYQTLGDYKIEDGEDIFFSW